MTVAVVIPHFGEPGPTLRLTRALAGQADRIVVVDDCSPVPFPPTAGVEVVRRDVNGGFGQAVNSGVTVVDEQLVLVLNSDVEVGPSFVTDLVAAAAPYQPCVAAPRVVDPAGRVAETARLFPTVTQQVAEWLTPLARFRDTDRWHEAVGHDLAALRSADPVQTGWLVGAALLLPTAALRSVGGFDPRFFMNAEEVDLQRRLREAGVPSVYVPSVTLVHEGGGSSAPGQRRRWLVEGRWRYAAKWGGTWAGTVPLAAGLTSATAVNLVWNAVRRLRGVDVRPLAVARDELRLVGTMRGGTPPDHAR